MDRFTATLDDDRLWRVIRGRGAFRRFKDLIAHHPDVEEQWYAYQDPWAKGCLLRWLDAHDTLTCVVCSDILAFKVTVDVASSLMPPVPDLLSTDRARAGANVRVRDRGVHYAATAIAKSPGRGVWSSHR